MLLRFPNEYAKVSSYRDIIHRQDFILDLLTWVLMDEMMSRHNMTASYVKAYGTPNDFCWNKTQFNVGINVKSVGLSLTCIQLVNQQVQSKSWCAHLYLYYVKKGF